MADTDLSGTVLDGRYQVIEPIAEGAMGSVYRGERMGLGRAVAIKVMHQELPDELASRQRFEREAKLMALLEHPNCVSVMDFGVHEDKPFLVMDLVRGTSLIQLLDEVGRLEPARACDIIRQVLAGLAHAHELGIVHRDIKPANIMISEKAGFGQQVRILDFGLARLTEGSTKLTTGIVVGTPNYMSPEQCKGGDIDARTDLYACGVMLFEMLTGRKPFVADDPIQVVRKHIMEKPPTLASVTPNIDYGELETVIAKALSKASKDRYASAVEMAKAVEAAVAKVTKQGAAALYARAIPEGAAQAANQQATMSGWNVPPDPQASIQLSDSAILPMSTAMPPVQSGAMPAPGSPPPPPHAMSPGSPLPPPHAMSPGGHAMPPPPPDNAATIQAPPPFVPPGTDGAATVQSPPFIPPGTDGAATVQSPPPVSSTESGPTPASGPNRGSLPPLPQAGPYVPPPAFQTGPAPVVPSAQTGPARTVPSAQTGPARTVPSAQTGPAPVVAPNTPSGPISTGAPDGSLAVPPTRPSTVAHPRGDRPIPQLPLTKKQLMIAAGGVVALVAILVIALGGDAKKQTTATRGSATPQVPEESASDAVPQVVERANALIEGEKYEDAVATLRRARKAHPDNAELAFLSGKANFGRLWWTDGVADFREAIELDASYKENPELLKTVLKGFITTPDVDERIAGFMREIGPPFRPYLEETAEKHPRKAIRARARAELNARP